MRQSAESFQIIPGHHPEQSEAQYNASLESQEDLHARMIVLLQNLHVFTTSTRYGTYLTCGGTVGGRSVGTIKFRCSSSMFKHECFPI